MHTKILCFYLPQFHETEHNNLWWGKGYTEWTAVKNAKRMHRKQRMPRVPLNGNYYDLSDESGSVWKWQAKLAKEHGIDGFVIYHYWFGGQKELNRPAEILLAHPEIDIEYSFCWDSNSWRRTWYDSKKPEILVEQNYGGRDMWRRHFDDLLPFFRDERYLKKNGKPVFHIYRPGVIPCLSEIKRAWNGWAVESGLNGIWFVFQNHHVNNGNESLADACYNFEPNRVVEENWHVLYRLGTNIRNSLNKHTRNLPWTKYNIRSGQRVLELIEEDTPVYGVYQGTFAGYDDSPRRQKKAVIYTEFSAKRYEEHIEKLLRQAEQCGNDYIYINAWNEWGESAYLEPDTVRGYAYLNAVRAAVNRVKAE